MLFVRFFIWAFSYIYIHGRPTLIALTFSNVFAMISVLDLVGRLCRPAVCRLVSAFANHLFFNGF